MAPEDVTVIVSCPDEATKPVLPVIQDARGRYVLGELINEEPKPKWAIICEREIIYHARYTQKKQPFF
jgi:hypothetical protein